ncbi:hypothetical protein BaRGS_00034899, partial [Batillaria attramentaria]
LHAYRTCKSSEMAARGAVDMMEEYNVLGSGSNSTAPLLGILGPERTNEAIVVSRMIGSMPEDKRLLQISSSATGEALSDRTLYPNFFRVIPPDTTQVKVLLELLVQIKWNYVAIVYDDDAYGRQAATRLRALAQDRHICVPLFEALPLDHTSEVFDDRVKVITQQVTASTESDSRVKGIVFIGGAVTAKEFVERVDRSFVRFIFSEGLGLQGSVLKDVTRGKGALTASPPYLPLPEFKVYWSEMWNNRTLFSAEAARNPWLDSFDKQQTKCQQLPLDEACLGDTSQWLTEFYELKAVAVFVALLEKLHADACGNSGLCPGLKALLNRRSEILQTLQENVLDIDIGRNFPSSFGTFQGQTVAHNNSGEIVDQNQNGSVYDVYNFQECTGNKFCFRKNELSLTTSLIKGYGDRGEQLSWALFPKAQCQDDHDCTECVPEDISGEVAFVKGDFYFVAVAPVHNPDGSLQCGGLRTFTGTNLVEGILFALEQVNNKTGPSGIFSQIFGNKKLGVIVIDSCYNQLVIKERLIDLYKGNLRLPDGTNTSGIVDKIAGFVGAYFSDISVSMYEVLSKVKRPFVMVSPTNTSPVLSDRETYPFYLRLATPVVRAILSLIHELGSNYIQIIYDPDDVYSLTMKESLDQMSSSFNVCVAQGIETRAYVDSNLNKVRDAMRKYPSAKVVVVLLILQHVKNLTNVILPQMSDDDDFVFIGADGWAKRTEVLEVKNSKKLRGSLTVSLDLPLDQRYAEYLRKVDPLNTISPWLRNFWELRKACYFDGSFLRKDKTDLCPENLTSDYKQDPWTPFFIQTVYAFALGLDDAMAKHCGNRTAKLDLYGDASRENVFDDNGDGVVRIKIYEISPENPGSSAMEYIEVGRYDPDSLVLNNKAALWIVKEGTKGECDDRDCTKKCFQSPQQNPSSEGAQSSDNNDSSILIPTVIVIVLLVVVIIVLVIVVIVFYRRRIPKPRFCSSERRHVASDHMSVQEMHRSVSQISSGYRPRQETRPVPVSHSLPAFYRQNSPPAPHCDSHQGDNNYIQLEDPYDKVDKTPEVHRKRIASDPAVRPMPPVPVSDYVSERVSLSKDGVLSRDPRSGEISPGLQGYVLRESSGEGYPSGNTQSSDASPGDSGDGSKVFFSLPVEDSPIQFENDEIPTQPPRRCNPADPDYLTPSI